MNIRLLVIGKTADYNLEILIQDYINRLKHYCSFQIQIGEPKLKRKKNDQELIKKEEGRFILEQIDQAAFLVILDEKGKEFNSVGFSKYIQKLMNSGFKEVVFCIGGAYGFSEEIYQRANAKIALSQMTLTHQMIRLLFVEQLYRGFTILKGEKYHH
ncbi:MAG: 23S rRNA (pseudouridine(1915)-N(3))-methyltransferase RlmH [Bacteroidetes bacterium]|nr:MAG: 23S rRNA (pseudouridine(1915)-N(3))-methyltransferase RlmH [Bacteroidota bacterium]MBL1144648.1 23S rRNA (pseudouridine(1915)-N(3))-methyltransferase RlmH [Bacteroidota bacterium]MCB0802190.1 23S rRNA (pseudouridine(1915)-N(3))-methyltransferase RlmH [Flavobacteriales bacterium]NOG57443.1 23S rRNA (pseudouridine(1915)-N(3))-methyltransferase RlmH [Bacteroidota bacterium]